MIIKMKREGNWFVFGIACIALLFFAILGCDTTPVVIGDPVPTTSPSQPTNNQSAAGAVAQMRIGWNLGNSLDAVGGETNWNNPRVTRTLINSVADQGFDVVRIPVTWVKHFGSAPNYTIDSAWMNRVAEVVNYVLDAGMYAIINIHHDGAENGDGEWLKLDQGNYRSIENQFVKIWTQIANKFKNYDDGLLFESMNEIHVGYNEPPQTHYNIINNLNQAFVNTVRATGGNNSGRLLVVPGYNTNIGFTIKGFNLPNDTARNKLILAVHFYDPWTFALTGETRVWGESYNGNDGWGQESHVREQFDSIKSFASGKGVPVIIGEYGAVRNKSTGDTYRRYYMEYVTKAAHDRGLLPIYWDNGNDSGSGEAFALFDRNSGAVIQSHKSVLDAMLRAVNSNYSINSIAKP